MVMYRIRTLESTVYVLDQKDLEAVKQILILLGYNPSQCTIESTIVDPMYHLVRVHSEDAEAYRLKDGKLDKVFFKP